MQITTAELNNLLTRTRESGRKAWIVPVILEVLRRRSVAAYRKGGEA